MQQLSSNSRFNNALNSLPSFKREKLCNNIEKLAIKYPNLHFNTYIAILDKLYKKDVSRMDISAGTYMNAVDIWNKFIVDSGENFDLLISGEDLVF
jgi:hypothetical protein